MVNHPNRTKAAANQRSLDAARIWNFQRLIDALSETFPQKYIRGGIRDNLVLIYVGGVHRVDVERVLKNRKSPVHAALRKLYAVLPEPQESDVEVVARAGEWLSNWHPRRRKLNLLLSAIRSTFRPLPSRYGATAEVGGGDSFKVKNDNSLLVHVTGVSLADLEDACRSPGRVRRRLKDVCDTATLREDFAPLSPIVLRAGTHPLVYEEKTVTYADMFKDC